MRRSAPIVPQADDHDVYLVLDDFGALGRSWRETDELSANRAAVIQDLLEGQYNAPVRVIAFNIAEGWSRDLSEEIADELAKAFADEDKDVPTGLRDFIEQHGTGRAGQLTLPLRRTA